MANADSGMKECECGCGAVFDAYDAYGRPRRFLKGHYNRPPKLEGEALQVARSSWSKTYNEKLRQQVMDAYGGRCSCCEESEFCFLTIDHVDRNGAEQRRTHGYGTGASFYRWLIEHGCPKDDYQCLCWNCNSGRELNGGICPHEVARQNELGQTKEIA